MSVKRQRLAKALDQAAAAAVVHPLPRGRARTRPPRIPQTPQAQASKQATPPPHLHVHQARPHLLGVDHAAAAVQREAVLAQRAALQLRVLPGWRRVGDSEGVGVGGVSGLGDGLARVGCPCSAARDGTRPAHTTAKVGVPPGGICEEPVEVATEVEPERRSRARLTGVDPHTRCPRPAVPARQAPAHLPNAWSMRGPAPPQAALSFAGSCTIPMSLQSEVMRLWLHASAMSTRSEAASGRPPDC